ncbi:hypothetical protein IFM89_029063 [Coptis chinensis]|uniref:Bidirectional sugar transporter SWEET n=1 Tax=Coptis chinensis TaxID=261450 RepID=A0A835IH11_9MAGN|nr:hypothetical protein IFM89_029063 [Coptis chinensis]
MFAGQVTSFFLFLSPGQMMWTIHKRKDVEDFMPIPLVAGVMNCLMWVFYGLPFVTKSNVLIVTINSLGLAMELFYVAVYYYYAHLQKKRWKSRTYVMLMFIVIIVAFILFAGLTLEVFPRHSRGTIAGWASTIFSICLYASPLSAMWTVWTTKSVEYLPLLICCANLLNGTTWAGYALIRMDYFVLVSNGIGAILGVLQLLLYATFRKPGGGDDDKKKSPQKQDLELGSIGNLTRVGN